eukprot:TRINITY_DN9848_c0_g1_i1.p1 TRINITY_DN9848_c0_g1~~TRINITY_DN9848_c0_g1_i1.p1  ORF type:complete len:515 (-),score=28.33 TRINITY_DN9848_c0_g1_i1:107-1651(-)
MSKSPSSAAFHVDNRIRQGAYAIVFIFLFFIFHDLYKLSLEYGDGWRGVTNGWLANKSMDQSDIQYRNWRSNFPLLIGGLAVYVTLSNFVRKYTHYKNLIKFHFVAGLIIQFVLHGTTLIWPLMFILVSYSVTKATELIVERLQIEKVFPFVKTSSVPFILAWALNLTFLLFVQYYGKFPQFFTLYPCNLTAILDRYSGIMEWETYFKMTFLRLVSFAFDYFWANTLKESSGEDFGEFAVLQESDHPLDNYNAINFLAYVFYFPLYIAGPITTFNAFLANIKKRQSIVSNNDSLRLLFQSFVYMLALEIVLHFNYGYAFNEHKLWNRESHENVQPYQAAIMGYWTLNFMYMKFLIIWRFFRCAALLDGIFVPENMIKCINRGVTFSFFWRSWHRSLYLWIIRHLYLPLGGKKRPLVALVVFGFIAVWHDLNWNWGMWAILNIIGTVIEKTVINVVGKMKFVQNLKPTLQYKIGVTILATINLFWLILANLAIQDGLKIFEFTRNAFTGDGSTLF